MAQRIGIVTSGGDCPGLNAAIIAVVKSASLWGWEVVGIRNGTEGLLASPPATVKLDLQDIDISLLRQGGTFLGTNSNGNPLSYHMPDGNIRNRSDEMIDNFVALGLSAMIVVGGDGTFRIFQKLADHAAKRGQKMVVIGIPKTIDNDVSLTDVSIGFDSAVSVAVEAIDRLWSTARSHRRFMVLEVMGRDTGHIALSSGIAGGADMILIPEIPYNMGNIAAHIESLKTRGYGVVVVGEGVRSEKGEAFRNQAINGNKSLGGAGEYISGRISRVCGVETRSMSLGHMQRGADPTWNDRNLAVSFGSKAVEMIAAGESGRMLAINCGQMTSVALGETEKRLVLADDSRIISAKTLGICLGA